MDKKVGLWLDHNKAVIVSITMYLEMVQRRMCATVASGITSAIITIK